MAKKIETNCLVAKSSKKYVVFKKTALKTNSGWWSYAWLKKMLKMSPIVTWQILTWPTKKKNPPSSQDQPLTITFTIKLLWSESLL